MYVSPDCGLTAGRLQYNSVNTDIKKGSNKRKRGENSAKSFARK